MVNFKGILYREKISLTDFLLGRISLVATLTIIQTYIVDGHSLCSCPAFPFL
jgi:hypothetical protein